MRRLAPCLLVLAALALAVVGVALPARAQNGAGTIVFLNTRPPRDLTGNIRGWAAGHEVHTYQEDTTSHAWRIQFMAFFAREPSAAEVTLVFYHVEPNRTRRYVLNEPVAIANRGERMLYYNTSLHRGPDEFQPMENYEVAVTVADARGTHEIARGRLGLVGQVERHSGVVDFTGSGGPTVH